MTSTSQNYTSSDASANGDAIAEENLQVAWWCRIGVKAAAAVAGGICIFLGVLTCISISAKCIVAGILQILLGCFVLVFEVPICFQYLQITKPISTFAVRRTFFQKAFMFAGPAIIPVAICFTWSTIVGCGLVFAVGVLYGLMALGKKADMDTMRARAVQEDKVAIVPNIVVEPQK